jgi:EmrB/QacA subfamily drug resistance transporter
MRDRRWAVLGAALAGTAIGTLNNSVANVAVVDVLDDFDLDLSAGVWFVTGYVLAFSVLMPAAGRLGDAHGVRRIYLAGLLAFAATSAFVALAPTYPLAVAGRVAQGVSNAAVLPTVMVTVVRVFPPGVRGRAMGVWASVNGAAIAAGPPLGGLITVAFGWRAVFWLDVPLALGAYVAARRLLPEDRVARRQPADLVGGALLSAGLVALMVGLALAPDQGIASPTVLALVTAGTAALVGFWLRTHRVADPFLAVEVLRDRTFAVLSGVASLQMVVLYGVLFVSPLLLSTVFDASLGAVGAMSFVLPVSMVIAGPSMGHFADRFGARKLTAAGGVVLVGASALLAVSAHFASLAGVLVGLGFVGVGVSAIQTPTAVGVAEQIEEVHRGSAMGLFHTTRFLAGVLGTAVAAGFVGAVAGGTLDGVTDTTLERAFATSFVAMAVVAVALVCATRLIPPTARRSSFAGQRLMEV